jgi:flagellar assembly protein FliH
MASVSKFMFAADFRGDTAAKQAVSEAGLVAARGEGLRAGVAEGRAQVLEELEASTNATVASLTQSLEILLAEMDQRTAAIEDAAAGVAVILARKLAGEALADRQLAGIEAAARDGLLQARGAPHLAIRVHDTLVEQVDRLLARLTREAGFAGRIVVLGEPDIRPRDARIEWADGGIVVDRGALDRSIDDVIAEALGEIPTGARPQQSIR